MTVTYQLRGFDQKPVTDEYVPVMVRRGDHWFVAADHTRPATFDESFDEPWVAGPVRVRVAAHSLVVVSARAPCKTPAMMLQNIGMMAAVCDALAKRPVAHLVYVSSDAVYADGPLPLTEASPAAPTSLHGAMHLAREQMLLSSAGSIPLAILRPTLVYGAGDPHNGYGPNRFRRQANRGETIVLFGEGEERRDHVDVGDIAEIVALVLDHRSAGVLNIATGTVASFRALADKAVALAAKPVAIKSSPRNGPMPHNGYRPFDPAATLAAFPGFRYTAIHAGLARAQRQEFG
jgi:nucleoside-diphosphate-sugar epimerase